MNILLINHYAGSPEYGMEYRPYYLAKEWVQMGHCVTIIAASFSHVRSIQPKISGSLTKELIKGIQYLWIKTPAYRSNNLGRLRNMFVFIIKLLLKCRSIARENYDVVIASSTYPLDIYPARKIARKCGARLIFELHDLWPLSPIELGGFKKNHPFIKIMQKGEDYYCKHSDRIISILPNTKEYLVSHGLNAEKWFCVPNGIDVEEWNNSTDIPSEHASFLNEQKEKNNFLVGYIGSLGLANALDSFINAAKFAGKNITFVMVGKGPEKLNLENKITKEKITNVFILNPVQKRSVPILLKHFDLLYIGLQSQSLFRFGISPNKLFDYMMAEKPIIQAIRAGNDIVSDAKCGVSVEPENPLAIANAIKQLMDLTPVEREKLGKNGKNYVIKNHDFKVLAKQFINVIENIHD